MQHANTSLGPCNLARQGYPLQCSLNQTNLQALEVSFGEKRKIKLEDVTHNLP